MPKLSDLIEKIRKSNTHKEILDIINFRGERRDGLFSKSKESSYKFHGLCWEYSCRLYPELQTGENPIPTLLVWSYNHNVDPHNHHFLVCKVDEGAVIVDVSYAQFIGFKISHVSGKSSGIYLGSYQSLEKFCHEKDKVFAAEKFNKHWPEWVRIKSSYSVYSDKELPKNMALKIPPEFKNYLVLNSEKACDTDDCEYKVNIRELCKPIKLNHSVVNKTEQKKQALVLTSFKR